MSGEKRRYIRLENQEVQRLRQLEQQLRAGIDITAQLRALQQQGWQQLQQRLLPSRTQAELPPLVSQLRHWELQAQQRLEQQQQQWQQAIAEQLAYRHLMGEQTRYLQKLIEAEQAEREREQLLLQQQLQAIAAQQQRQAEFAQGLLADVAAVWQQIDGHYPHQRFAPGRLEELSQELTLARQNLAAQLPQAAIATAQRTYLALADLRWQLHQQEQQWQLLYQATFTELASLILQVQAHRSCQLAIGEGEASLNLTLEVDYWTRGRLSEYEATLQALQEQLGQGATAATLEELQEINRQLERQKPLLSEILEQAQLAIVNSQLRLEIADRVVKTLSALGYTLIDAEADATYEGNDYRNAYALKMKNLAGDEVVTVIAPEGEFGLNSLSINTFSQTFLDETATHQNAQAIFAALEAEGVRAAGPLECYPQARQEYQHWQQLPQKPEKQQIMTGEAHQEAEPVAEPGI